MPRSMSNHPIFLKIRGRPCVVIGAGRMATPRILDLARAGARVTVIAPELGATAARTVAEHGFRHLPRPYARGDLRGHLVAYAATGRDDVHRAIREEADTRGILLNVVDVPELCDFITPSIVRRGRLTLAISTGGASPAMAQRLRRELESQIGSEYDQALAILAALRPALKARGLGLEERSRALARLVNSAFLQYVRDGKRAEIDRLLVSIADDISLEALGFADWTDE